MKKILEQIKEVVLKRKVLISAIIIAFLAGLILGGQAHAYDWKQKYIRFSGVAGETIAIGDVLAIKDADGLVYNADMDDAALDNVVGVAGNAAASGSNVEIVPIGILSGFTALGEGQTLYADSDPGEYTTGKLSGTDQQVGTAISTTRAFINIQDTTD